MAKLIDIDQVIKDKNKKIPSFVISFLKKIVHQDEINKGLLEKSNTKDGAVFIDEALNFLDVKLKAYGIEKLDKSKQYIFVSNHPLGGLDGLTLGQVLSKNFNGNFKFLANDLLMNFEALKTVSIPINKLGSQSRGFASGIEETLQSDTQLLLFPAGSCSRFRPWEGGICDQEWRKTFISCAIKHQRDIVPIYYKGRNSFFFYALAFLRKNLGIKINIEMLFLSNEMFKNRHKKFQAYFGEPISWKKFADKSKSPKEFAQLVRSFIYTKKETLA